MAMKPGTATEIEYIAQNDEKWKAHLEDTHDVFPEKAYDSLWIAEREDAHKADPVEWLCFQAAAGAYFRVKFRAHWAHAEKAIRPEFQITPWPKGPDQPNDFNTMTFRDWNNEGWLARMPNYFHGPFPMTPYFTLTKL